MEVDFSRFQIHQLAGNALLAAEAASYFNKTAVLAKTEIVELILMNAFGGINELYLLKSTVVEEGLIVYLRQAVKALGLCEMTEVANSVSQTQMRERTFAVPKATIFRAQSLFQPG